MITTKNPLKNTLHLINHYFIWIIISSYLVATVFPEFGLWIRVLNLGSINVFKSQLVLSVPLIMLASLLFNAGLGVKLIELKHVLHKPFLLLGGVLGNIAIPLLFIMVINFIMHLWHEPEELQQILVGLALVASMPIAGGSTAWVQNANGNLALSLGLVLVSTLLSPLLTPTALHAVGFIATGDYAEDLHELANDGVASFLGIWVILPSLLGILMRWIIGEDKTATAMPYLKLINYGVLTLLIYSNASLTLPNAVFNPDIDFLVIIISIVTILCICTFASGYFLAHFFHADRKETVSLVFGLGMNNTGTGLVIASLTLADHAEVMLPIIIYNLIQYLLASVIFSRQGAR